MRAIHRPQEIAEGIYRLGTDWVNWYLCRAEGEVTLLDCGFRGYYDQLPAAMEALGMPMSAIGTVVLTHYHPDHVGFGARVREETGAGVLVPEGDAEGVRTGKIPVPSGMAGNAWRPVMIRYLSHMVANRGTAVQPIDGLTTYAAGEVLPTAIPLRAVSTPGHTRGHSSLLADDRGVFFAGDALATVDFLRREEKPALLPFTEDAPAAQRSLESLDAVSADVVAPGHGEVLHMTPARAGQAALAAS